MFWFSAAFATGFSTPPRTAWVDAKCNPLDGSALPAERELRLLWSQTSSSSPPGGPVSTWTDTLDPEGIRLRQQGCGVETIRFEQLKKTCGDVPVLRWAGPLKRGARYSVESHGHPVAHMKVQGPSTSKCRVPPLEPTFEEHTVGPLELDIRLPAWAVTVADGRTYVELSLQKLVSGTVAQAPTFTPVVSGLGEAEIVEQGVEATWTVTRRVHASTLPDAFGDPMCSVGVYVEAALVIPGVDGTFEQRGPNTTDGASGPCEPGTGRSLATEEAIRADLEARLARLLDPPSGTAQPNLVLEEQRRELAVTQKAKEYREDPITALEGLVRRSAWREPEAAILLARHLMDAKRYLEAAHYGNQALRIMPMEPSPPRAPILMGVAEAAAAGIEGCEGRQCHDFARIGGDALRAYRSIHPGDPRSDEIEATLRAGLGQ